MAAQHDLDLANQIGAAFRADLNLMAIAMSSKQWGPSAPPTLLSYMDWMDTTTATKPKWKLYDGAQWLALGSLDTTNHLWMPVIGGGTNTIASASTTDLSTIVESGITVSGTTTITALGTVPAGQIKRLTFSGILTLTYNATSLILPGAANILTAAGDTCLAESLGAGNWRLYAFSFATAKTNAGLVTEASVASASTTNLGAAAANIINITGTTTITAFGSSASLATPLYFIRFAAALTLTYNATSLKLPTAANILTAADDTCVALYLGSGNWQVLSYTRAAGTPVNHTFIDCGLAGGTANALTLTPTPPVRALLDGQIYSFRASAKNTASATAAVSGLTAKTIYKNVRGSFGTLQTLAPGDLGWQKQIKYDSTGDYFILMESIQYSHGADVASAGTLNIDDVTGDLLDVTGTTTVTAITLSEGNERTVRFSGALKLTNGASLVLPNGVDFYTQAGDMIKFRGYASGVVRVVGVLPLSGLAAFPGIPQNSKSAAYTTVMSDNGKHILHPSADTTARIFTIDSNANVPYPIGATLTFINQNAGGVITISITSDTMRLAGAGTTGSRTLAANGIATAVKLTSTEWIISGTGLT